MLPLTSRYLEQFGWSACGTNDTNENEILNQTIIPNLLIKKEVIQKCKKKKN